MGLICAVTNDHSIGAGCAPLASGGLVVGAVKDINTNLFLATPLWKMPPSTRRSSCDNSADASHPARCTSSANRPARSP